MESVERWSFYFGVWLQYETWKCTYILNPVFNIIFPIGITMAFVLFYAIYKVCTYPSGPVVYIQMILFFRRLFIIYRFCSGPIQLSPFFQRFAWVLLYNILSTTTTYFWSYLFESILPHTPIFKVFYFLLFVSINWEI